MTKKRAHARSHRHAQEQADHGFADLIHKENLDQPTYGGGNAVARGTRPRTFRNCHARGAASETASSVNPVSCCCKITAAELMPLCDIPCAGFLGSGGPSGKSGARQFEGRWPVGSRRRVFLVLTADDGTAQFDGRLRDQPAWNPLQLRWPIRRYCLLRCSSPISTCRCSIRMSSTSASLATCQGTPRSR